MSNKNAVLSANANSVEELREWYNKYGRSIENYAKISEVLKLYDPNSSSTKTYNVFNKTKLRRYMQNPLAYTSDLRNLSIFLYNRCNPYRRLINYLATFIDTTARAVIPMISLVKDNDPEKIKKSYYKTLTILENMNLQLEMFKASVIAWREDTFYGCAYYDDTGYFIYPCDPEYCKIAGSYLTGDLSFFMDMRYFQRRQDLLEWLGEPFTSMYREYEKDTSNNRWQLMPDEYCVCFKINIENLDASLPPIMSMFNSLINLADLEDIQAVADEQDIYKLLIATIPINTKSEDVDDFSVDPATALDYYNKMLEAIPQHIGMALSPIPITPIDFKSDQAADVSKVEKATETLFNTSGGAQILNSATAKNSTSIRYMSISDMKYATAALRPQIEGYLNRFLSYHVSKPAKVKLLEVSPYLKEEYKKKLLEDATYGIPTALVVNSMNGFTELETLSLNFLQNEILDISNTFVPLKSSHTQSASDGNEKDDDELSDEGVRTKDGDKNAD